MRSVLIFAIGALITLATSIPAWAAKASAVTRVDGRAYIVRASDSNWLACWAEMPDGKSRLYVIETNKGDIRTVATESLPGGLTWIRGRDQLLYCQGVYVEPIKATRVYYFVYDVATKESRKIIEVTDFSDAYQADPISSDDGSAVFHMTMDGNYWPSFNVYRPNDGTNGVMQLISSQANIGAQYDVSSDGSRVYWLLHDPKTAAMSIACWNINAGSYEALYEFPRKADPAEDHMFLKVDSTKRQAAAIVTSAKDPLLQLSVYLLDKQASVPFKLVQGEQVDFFDWKGRSGTIYALISNPTAKQFYVEEIDPFTGARRRLFNTAEQMYSIEYGPDSTYFFTMVDNRNTNRPQTTVMRLK